MTKLPKELTPELLSLVLGKEVPEIRIDLDEEYRNGIDNCIVVSCWDNAHKEFEECYDINLDTLGRLCKEWCIKQGYLPALTYNEDLTIWMVLHNMHGNEVYSDDYRDTIELEAIIKATEWVAIEKGLL